MEFTNRSSMNIDNEDKQADEDWG